MRQLAVNSQISRFKMFTVLVYVTFSMFFFVLCLGENPNCNLFALALSSLFWPITIVIVGIAARKGK